MTTESHIRDAITILDDDLRALMARLDAAQLNSPVFLTLERQIDIKYKMRADYRERLDGIECNAAREAAEARLAFHAENDTLDMY